MAKPGVSLVADDEVLLAVGVSRILGENGIEVVGAATSADEVAQMVMALRPEVL